MLDVVADHSAPGTSTARPTPGSATPTRCPRSRRSSATTAARATFDTVTLDTAAYEALYAKRADFVITFSAWEGIEAGAARHPAADVPVHRLRLPGLLPGGPRLRPRLAGGRTRTPRRRSWARRCAGFELAAADPDEAAAILVGAEPGRVRRQPGAAGGLRRGSWPSRGYCVDAAGKVGVPDAGAVDRLLVVPVRAGPAGRRRRQAARRRRRTTRSLFTNDFLP